MLLFFLILRLFYTLMRKFLIVALVWITVQTAQAQKAIHFEKSTFAELKAKAKLENKLIFLDGYTSWCAPCKWMEGNTFLDPAVADFYNANFINTKFDCEVGEGIEIAKKYAIRSFPTYLFLDAEGELVYRTQSRMDAKEFLEEGKRAFSKDYHLPTLRAQFAAGDRSPEFLIRYYVVMSKADQEQADAAKQALNALADPSFLKSKAGWEVINLLAQNGQDKFGMFFMENKDYFKSVASAEDFDKKELQLLRYSMYNYIRSKDKAAFDKGLVYFAESADREKQVDAAMYKVEWVGSHGTDAEFVKLTTDLSKGTLKEEADKLSFIARRYANNKYATNKEPSKAILEQCYNMAKQAVKLDENSYSNQGTLAEICITLKKKKEAIKAAEAARMLAELETSKIINIADKLLERAKNI